MYTRLPNRGWKSISNECCKNYRETAQQVPTKKKKEKMNLRRLRQNPHILELTASVTLTPKKFIQPLFVTEGIQTKQAVPGLPRVFQETPDSLLKQVELDLES